jgi:hypothetical protein
LTEILETKNLDKIALNETNLKLALLEFIEGLHYLSEVFLASPSEKYPAFEHLS